VKKIASMAEVYDVAMAPHCPLGPLALASCLQVDAVAPNALIQEQSLDIHYNESNDVLDYLGAPSVFDSKDGYVDLPNKPGLGIEIDEDYVRERAEIDVNWHNPVWRHDDGSVAEW
jgi:galactonate dehydratase